MTTVNGPSGIDLEPIRGRATNVEHRRHTEAAARIVSALWLSADDLPALVEEVEALRAQVSDAEARGYRRAVEALRFMERSAADGLPFQTIADAIVDVSYVGKQVTRGHGRYLAYRAIIAIADYLEAAQRSITTTEASDGR